MASKTNSRVGRSYVPFSTEIKAVSIRMASQDISQWKTAIDSARNIINPRRKLLYELYDNIKLDGHLLSVMNKRTMGITNKRILFTPEMGVDTVDAKISDLILEAPWFFDFRKHAAEAVPFGHSLIELVPAKDGINIIEKSVLINRANVKPEKGFVAYDAINDSNGIYYKGEQADPAYSQTLIEVGGEKDYGLLMSAAQYVIYKRGGFGDWAQFAELFGMPFRVGKYDQFDDTMRKKLDTALSTMGGAGYAVIPNGSSLEFFNNVQSGQSDIFKNLIELANAEISKLFLGQTMTTDNGSSKSQSDTHKKVEEDINMNDMIQMEYILNWDFKTKLYAISTIADLQKGKFRFPQTIHIPLEKRWEMDIALSAMIPMSEEYFYKTYGISKPGDGEVIVVPPIPEPPAAPPASGQVKKKSQKLSLNYGVRCCVADYKTLSAKIKESDLTSEETDLINAIYNKDGVKYDYKTFQKNTDKLRAGLMEGLSKSAIDYGTPDNVAATMMEVNINRFGFDKNIAQIYHLNQALKQTETFAEFKKEAVKVLGNFNRNYLETEYNFAIATAQNASAWNQQKANQKDFPYVKYVTAGDGRVRPAHAALDGKIFRLDDKSWTGIYPPNGFGCRCEMISINDPGKQTIISTGDDAKQALGEEWGKMQKGGFAVNRGELNEVFDLNKSYVKGLPDSAIQDTNKLTYKDAELKKWSDITGLNTMPVDKEATRNSLLKEFDDNKVFKKIGKDEYALNVFKDYNKREIGIIRNTLDKHIKGKYEAEKRHEFYHNVKDVLSKPDEVYFLMIEGKQPTYRYIKFYSDEILVVNVDISELNTLDIKTWYVSDKQDAVRSGVLIKKK